LHFLDHFINGVESNFILFYLVLIRVLQRCFYCSLSFKMLSSIVVKYLITNISLNFSEQSSWSNVDFLASSRSKAYFFFRLLNSSLALKASSWIFSSFSTLFSLHHLMR
jgi:hypothetical protein